MSDPQDAGRVADREAAEWHVRLGERPLSAATLAEFRTWRERPDNAEAYQRVETLWRSAGALSGDAEIQTLAHDTLKASRPPSKAKRNRLLPAAIITSCIVIGAVSLFLWAPSRNTYSTAVGQQQLVRLADGSQVKLDTNTRLKVRFGRDERRVVLEQGQALFIVVHDTSRPFRVAAGATEVTALGTTFDVRRRATGAQVTLVAGAVSVTDFGDGVGQQWRLAPGQQLETSRPHAAPEAVDPAVATSWAEGRLVFRGVPLRDAVADVNRYLDDKILLAPGPVGATAVNGNFTTGDRDAFVSAASDLFDLTAEPQSDGSIRLVPSVGG